MRERKYDEIEALAAAYFEAEDDHLIEQAHTRYSPAISKADSGSVYLLLHMGYGYHKIGWTLSSDPTKRVRTLQTASPDELRLIGFFAAANSAAERRLHSLFLSKRVRGEWFKLSAEEVSSILDISWRKQNLVI